MAKKKQPDFQPLKMKVGGRRLPRGRNVTSTAFKSKPIFVKKQKQKETLILSIPESLKKLRSSNDQGKVTALNHLSNLITTQPGEFIRNFHEIMDKVPSYIRDPENDVRRAAIKVLLVIFEKTSDSQLQTFFPLLCATIDSAMTHKDVKIKETSFDLLELIFLIHPQLVIQSKDILDRLIGMLSNPSHKSGKTGRSRIVTINNTESIEHQDWNKKILSLLGSFFEAVVAKKNENGNIERYDNEVYWKCDKPLYLPIYAGSGLKPVDIENAMLPTLSPGIIELESSDKFPDFLSTLISLISDIFVEVIAGEKSVDDNMVSPETVDSLSVIFQVLIHLGEWTKSLTDVDNDNDFAELLHRNILKHLKKFPFHPRSSIYNPKYNPKISATLKQKNILQKKTIVSLNLAVCYLYCLFESKFSAPSLKIKVISYLKGIDEKFDIHFDYLPVLIKITNLLLASPDNTTEIVPNILKRMLKMLNSGDKNECRKLIFALFMQISLKPLSRIMTDDNSMEHWFSILFNELYKISKRGLTEKTYETDKKFLKELRVIANLKYPLFQECLDDQPFCGLKDYLSHKEPDIVTTAISLISHYKISPDMFQELSEIMLKDDPLPEETSIRLIRTLVPRYLAKDTSPPECVDFIQFLVNTAVDTVNICDKKWSEFDLPEFSEVSLLCKDYGQVVIYPSLHWKKHSKLFEVCSKSLRQFSSALVYKILACMTKEILEYTRIYPVHSVIALLRLNQSLLRLNQGKKYKKELIYQLIQDLHYGSLVFISMFTDVVTDKEWYEWNVVQLISSIEFDQDLAIGVLPLLEYESTVPREGLYVHYLLRILKVFVTRKLLPAEEIERVLHCLDNFIVNCNDEHLRQQTLFIRLYNYFNYYDM